LLISIIGRKPSKSIATIARKTGIRRYMPRRQSEVLVNYGLAGAKLEAYYKRFPSAKRIHTINKHVGLSKLHVLNVLKRKDIEVPVSKLTLTKKDNLDNFIEKRIRSIGGLGICKARRRSEIPGKYYQEFIKDRIYELRVHAFKWTKDWVVQKRVGPADALAWNFKQGGHFITIHNPGRYSIFKKARELSDNILDILGMSFGAVDFIVDKDYNIYFIEVNSAPGFTDLSEPIYIDAFTKLKDLSRKNISKLK